jgi:hypothetical protein
MQKHKISSRQKIKQISCVADHGKIHKNATPSKPAPVKQVLNYLFNKAVVTDIVNWLASKINFREIKEVETANQAACGSEEKRTPG